MPSASVTAAPSARRARRTFRPSPPRASTAWVPWRHIFFCSPRGLANHIDRRCDLSKAANPRIRGIAAAQQPQCELNQNATLEGYFAEIRLRIRTYPVRSAPAAEPVDFTKAPVAPAKGIRHANNDHRRHRHVACGCAGIWPKRGRHRHGAASGQARNHGACGGGHRCDACRTDQAGGLDS